MQSDKNKTYVYSYNFISPVELTNEVLSTLSNCLTNSKKLGGNNNNFKQYCGDSDDKVEDSIITKEIQIIDNFVNCTIVLCNANREENDETRIKVNKFADRYNCMNNLLSYTYAQSVDTKIVERNTIYSITRKRKFNTKDNSETHFQSNKKHKISPPQSFPILPKPPSLSLSSQTQQLLPLPPQQSLPPQSQYQLQQKRQRECQKREYKYKEGKDIEKTSIPTDDEINEYEEFIKETVFCKCCTKEVSVKDVLLFNDEIYCMNCLKQLAKEDKIEINNLKKDYFENKNYDKEKNEYKLYKCKRLNHARPVSHFIELIKGKHKFVTNCIYCRNYKSIYYVMKNKNIFKRQNQSFN